ncbi:hypothetical protein ACHWQZ_G000778 [Mnemiopsis leidyi]
MKIFAAVGFLTALLAVISAQAEDRAGNCYWGDKQPCHSETGCSYGCHKRICWSQCNGACAIKVVMEKLIAEGGSIENFNDFWKIIMADGTNCVKCPEWCYVDDGSKGYQACSANSDCDSAKANQCLSHCAMF